MSSLLTHRHSLFKFFGTVLSTNSQHIMHGIPVLREPIKLTVLEINLRLVDAIKGAGFTRAGHRCIQERVQKLLAFGEVSRALD